MDASPSPSIEIHPRPPDAWGRTTADFAYTGEGWAVVGQLVQTPRGIVIGEITISGAPAGEEDLQPITSTVLRQVPTGEILASALGSGLFSGPTQPRTDEQAEKRQPGRQPLSADLLRDVALRYLVETLPGRPRGAVQRLAEHYGKPPQMISRWVMRARRDGWLGPAVPGREGAEIGPRLLLLGSEAVGAMIAEHINSNGGNVVVMTPAEDGEPFHVMEVTSIEPADPAE